MRVNAAVLTAAPPLPGAHAPAAPATGGRPAKSGKFLDHLQQFTADSGSADAPKGTDPQTQPKAALLSVLIGRVFPDAKRDAVPPDTETAPAAGGRPPARKDGAGKRKDDREPQTRAVAAQAIFVPELQPQVVLPLSLNLEGGYSSPQHAVVEGATAIPAGANAPRRGAASADSAMSHAAGAQGNDWTPDKVAPVEADEKADGSKTGAPKAQELAFAAKVKSADAERQPAAAGPAAPSAPLKKQPAEAAPASEDLAQPSTARPAAISTFERPAEMTSTPEQPAQGSEIASSEKTLAAPAEQQTRPAPPLKDLSLNVTQPSHEKVQVRLSEHGGELRVAVRTADADLSHDLKQGLGDLVERLQETGFRAETWHPVHAGSAPATATDAHNSAGDSRNGDPQQQGRQSQEDRGQQNQNQNQNQNRFNRPRWVEELETSLTGTGQPSGGSNGFAN